MATNGGFQSSSGFSSSSTSEVVENDKPHDPASSGLFGTETKRFDDLREMLDSSDDKKKLDAMKRIIGLVAKGRDASSLFPAVVKNVVCKNLEVKKLVYVYLTRYAEEKQDLALLSIATFQRAMKDPNQLIRASALRVLSSIRVPVIVPIMMLVIKDGVNDMSPYVRKAAAHAIPKLYSVDAEQKEELISFLEKLLADKTTLVIGSAIQAFEELCPERIDLIHKNYRKLCSLLADVEEWGQVIIINMLTRYARTQFVDPNRGTSSESAANEPGKEKAFYSSEDDSSDSADDSEPSQPVYVMDPDHRLLLKSAKPLLNSRNSAVIMAVVQLYFHCAPKSEVGTVSRAIIRLLRSHKEIQYMVLSNIATMAVKLKGMFEPYIKSFYVRANDSLYIKLLKLEILTCLATETNVSVMMREFQQYVSSSEEEFAAATIHSIGKIASNISDIADACLSGLISLLSNKNEVVVGESVVVIKKLLQMKSSGHKDIIVHLSNMLDSITVANARSSILWLIGEYCDKVPKIAPDVLRKSAKLFTQEEDIVKLQTLNLAAKLCITNSKQTQLLCQYVFNLAKYDQSYDIRDRARFLRALILPGDNAGALAKHAKKIFLAGKPAPVLQSRFNDRDHYQLGSLSHILNSRAHGYYELPEWPEQPPPSDVRNVELPPTAGKSTSSILAKSKSKSKEKKDRGFYSSSESEDETDDSSEGDDDSSEEEEGTSTEGEDNSDEESEEEDESSEEEDGAKSDADSDGSSEAEESDEDSEESSEEESDESSSDEEPAPVKAKSRSPTKPAATTTTKDSQLLLDLLDNDQMSSGAAPPSLNNGAVLHPVAAGSMTSSADSVSSVQMVAAAFTPDQQYELLNRMTSEGLSAVYRFTRTSYLYSDKMVNLEITFTNHSDNVINNLRIGDKRLQSGMSLHEFHAIKELTVGGNYTVNLGIDFNDTLQPADFTIITSTRSYNVKVEAGVGELINALSMSEKEFTTRQGKLGGMNETSSSQQLPSPTSRDKINSAVLRTANLSPIPCQTANTLLYAGRTLSHKSDVLVKLVCDGGESGDVSAVTMTVNCEKIVIGSMLIKDLKLSLVSS